MTMSQWKALLKSNKKASSLPPTPVTVVLFTTACEKIKATTRQILQSASQTTAVLIYTALSVSTTRDEVLNALSLELSLVWPEVQICSLVTANHQRWCGIRRPRKGRGLEPIKPIKNKLLSRSSNLFLKDIVWNSRPAASGSLGLVYFSPLRGRSTRHRYRYRPHSMRRDRDRA